MKKEGDDYVTSGGRVILVIGEGKTVKEAKAEAYKKADAIESDGLFYRRDICDKAIKHEQ